MTVAAKHRPQTVVDLYYMRRMCADPTPVGLPEIAELLGLNWRKQVASLWNNTLNYLVGGLTEWPPTGEALNKRLPATGEPGLAWWPSHIAVLPPPDMPWTAARPRWSKGRVVKWALEVGRLTWSLDPVPRLPRARGHRKIEQAAPVEPVDLTSARRLAASDELWDTRDIARFYEVSEATVRHWVRACLNRWVGGVTQWPPGRDDRREVRTGRRSTVTWWPAHQRMLPPPDKASLGGTVVPATQVRRDSCEHDGQVLRPQFLWRAGDIAMWGLHTGRLLPDGTVVPLRGAA